MHKGWGAAAGGAGLILVLAGGFRHFTWWGFTSFTLYLLLKAAGKADDRELFFGAVALIIELGVLAMATLAEDGSMLSNAYRDLGPVGYFFGTFLIHYLPPAVIIASMREPAWSWRECTLLTGGLSLFAVYCSIESPDNIYGVPLDSVVASALGIGAIALTVYALWLFARR